MESQSPEIPEQKEVIVPPEIAHAFGRGLRQKTQDLLNKIKGQNTLLEICLVKSADEEAKFFGKGIASVLDSFSGLLTDFENAKEVKLVAVSGGWNFKFVGKEENASTPRSPLEMDENLTPKFILALRDKYAHTFGAAMSSLSSIVTYSKDNDAKEQAKKAYSSSLKLNEIVNKIIKPDGVNDASKFKVTTNGEGRITIASISKPGSNATSRP